MAVPITPDSHLHPLSDFVDRPFEESDHSIDYWYEGQCPRTKIWRKLPRTEFIKAIAQGLMQQLSATAREREGKMYGVLLVETENSNRYILKAFSGLLEGQSVVSGWVPPIDGRDQVALAEAQTLAALETIKQELLQLQQLPERQQYEFLTQKFEIELQELKQAQQQEKQARQQIRQQLQQTLTGTALEVALEPLNDQSRQAGIIQRRLKQQRDQALLPLQQKLEWADDRIRLLKQRRKTLSQALQKQMHAVYCLTNFAGESISIAQMITGGALPTGTGDCCTPKLLHYAATHKLTPLAMAEFWWGNTSNGDKISGVFYGTCTERCQPLMGFLLSGLSRPQPIAPLVELPILFEDEWLIVINKPSGLLSVPGRYGDRQESVLSRLQMQYPELQAVHRLDQDTSGVLLLAKEPETYRLLSHQFQQHQVHKRYEALLEGEIQVDAGTIDLPLWADPCDRPYQKVDWQRGKPSLTQFRVIDRSPSQTRIEFQPITGRTHQLRVHAAHPAGLGVPILGDRLYGTGKVGDRLHLHAKRLQFIHPRSNQLVELRAAIPF